MYHPTAGLSPDGSLNDDGQRDEDGSHDYRQGGVLILFNLLPDRKRHYFDHNVKGYGKNDEPDNGIYERAQHDDRL